MIPIRWMIRRDMPEVLAIESQCFAEFAWTEEDFLATLRQNNCIGMVAERDELILGFMLYELHRTRLHVVNFAVAPEFHRQRVGTAMIEKLRHKLSQQRRTAITLDVREQNLAMHLFLRERDFWCVGVERDGIIPEYGGGDFYRFRYDLDGGHRNVWHQTNRVSGFYEGATDA